MIHAHAEHRRTQRGSAGLSWSGWTDRGRFRQNNEDSFIGLQFDAREVARLGQYGEATLSHADLAFAVSDGMGGARSGEFASRIVVEKVTTLLPRSYRQAAEGLENGFADVMEELFEQIHRALVYVGASYEECTGMEATLSLAWFTPDWMYFGHIGDSRLYLLPGKGGTLRQLSHDDTHVGWLFRSGKLTEREARSHPRRNVLQKSLGGTNQFVDPQVGAVACESGDVFLLCTDGVVDGLRDGQIVELLKSSLDSEPTGSAARRLVSEAIEKGGRDNTTALVIRLD